MSETATPWKFTGSAWPFSPCYTSRDSWISRRPRSTQPCSTRASTSAPSGRCTECSPHTTKSGAAGSVPASLLRGPRVAGPPAQRAVELGHHEAAGAGEVDLFLSLRHPRRLQSVRRRLEGGPPGERNACRAVHPRDLRPPGDRWEPAHDP